MIFKLRPIDCMRKMNDKMKTFLEELFYIFKSKTGNQTALVFSMELLTASLGFLANVFVIRKLSVDEYGIFSLFSSTIMLVGGFSHLGWLESYVRFSSKYRGHELFSSVIKFFLIRILGSLLLVSSVWTLFAKPLSAFLFKRPDLYNYVYLAIATAGLLTLNSVFTNFLRIQQNFKMLFYLQTSQAFLRFLFLFSLFGFGYAQLKNILSTYLVVPFLFMVFHLIYFQFYCKRNDLAIARSQDLNRDLKREFTAYNWWLLCSIVTTCLIGNIDAYFLAYYHSSNLEIANLGAASRLTLPITMIVTSIGSVILPKLSGSKNNDDIKIYLDKLKKFLAPITILVFCSGTLAIPVLKAIAGSKYSSIGSLLFLQVISLTIIFAANPLGILLLIWGKTRYLAIMNFLQLLIDLFFNVLLIPKFGALGAISSTIIVNLFGLCFTSLFSRRYYITQFKDK